MIAAVIVLLLAGAGYFAYTNYIQTHDEVVASAGRRPSGSAPPSPPAAATPGAPKKSVRETVAEYLATNPTPDAMLAKGKEFAQAGELERGLPGVAPRRRSRQRAGPGRARVVLRSAGDAAQGAASRPTARAPPTGTSARRSPATPRRSASSVCCSPRAAPACRPIRAAPRAWLQQAAAQNDAEAKKALETLPK